MLSNPHWDAPSFSSFEAWLETKDPKEIYRYTDTNNCACAQYLKAVGKFDKDWLKCPSHSVPAVLNTLAGDHDYTFGGLLARLRKYRQQALTRQIGCRL